MFSLRQKIFIGYLIVFLMFIILMFPFASKTVDKIVMKTMEDRASELIQKLRSTTNDFELVERLKEQKSLIFLRVSVITNDQKVLYDTHKRIRGENFDTDNSFNPAPEVLIAMSEGRGFSENWSDTFEQRLVYLCKSFDFHGKKYFLRTAFPSKYVTDFTQNFEMGFLGLASAILLLFSLMTWFIINHLTGPIHQIIAAVRPFQEGESSIIPEIKLGLTNSSDDFSKLANTLNSLSSKVQRQIDTLIQERNEKEAILESLVEGVIATDNNHVVTFANNMALRLLDTSQENLLDNPITITDKNQFYRYLSTCQEKGEIITDTLEMRVKGEKLFLEIIAAPLKDKKGAILVLQDKSAHYKILEMRKNFIANASHELKTPITIVRGFAETLHDNPNLPQTMLKEITGKIVSNSIRMNNLVKDLLTMSDIENIPESRLTDIKIRELIENCSTMVKDAFPSASIEIHGDHENKISYMGDPNLLELAIMNLIENGVKYSDNPPEITINIEPIEGWIKIEFEDKGLGIPDEDIDRIFQRFYRVNKQHSRKLGGSGLGLSIVQTIIEKHFGKISVESTLGEGTTFTIYLPSK